MCLAIPAKIAQLDGDGMATVDILGVTRSVSIDLTPQAGVGDFVLVHAGFAIEVVDLMAESSCEKFCSFVDHFFHVFVHCLYFDIVRTGHLSCHARNA